MAFSLIACATTARAQIPSDALLKRLEPQGLINDYAGLLNAEDRRAIEERVNQLERDSGAQITLVTLRSLEGGDIEDFATRLFERWKIGKKGKDNGVLILVGVEDRKARIEVGYGLEGVLPDALAGRILNDKVLAGFRRGQFSQGLRDGAIEIAKIVEKNEPASEADRMPAVSGGASQLGIAITLAPFVMIGGFMLGLGLGIPRKRLALQAKVFAGFIGAFFSAVGLGIAYKLLQLAYAGVLTFLGLSMLRAGFQAGRAAPGKARWSGRRRSAWAPTWIPTPSVGWDRGWSGGSFGGGGSSWGGFGGGSSGGGGASGGW